MSFVHFANQDGWFQVPNREKQIERTNKYVRRSALIMPVNVPRFVEKAHTRGADAITLDLEDSVPEAEKSAARGLVKDAIKLVGRGGSAVQVRINKPFEHAIKDLDAAIWPGLTGIGFPKAESPIEIQILDKLIEERERARDMPVGSVLISVAIESALGVQDMAAIACASPRVISLSLGAEDFCRDIGVEPSPNGEEQLYGRGMVVIAARVAGVQASGLTSTLANFGDMEGMRQSATHAMTLGFRGASCIHPGMVQILNEAYSPKAEAVAYARRVIEVYDAAEAEGRASVALDGKMIDIPVVERARTLVQRADAIAQLEAQKAKALASLGE